MKRRTQYLSAMLPLALLVLAPLRAEEPEAPPAAKSSTDGKPLRDPTQLSPRMREMLAPKKEEARAAEVHKVLPKIPQIVLRGLVAGADGDGSAAIEIKGGTVYLVRTGSTVQATVDNQTLMLVVKSVAKDAIIIEIPELQQTLTIR